MLDNSLVVLDIKQNDGYYANFKQPSVSFYLSISTHVNDEISLRVLRRLQSHFAGLEVDKKDCSSVLYIYKAVYCLIFRKLSFPLYTQPEYEINSSFDIFCVFPHLGHSQKFMRELLNWVSNYTLALMSDCENDAQNFKRQLPIILKKVEADGLRGQNNKNIIKTSFELDVPWLKISSAIVQLGWGTGSKWFSSSIGPKTSAIGANVAKDKLQTTNLLRQIGFPILPNKYICTSEDALVFARHYGFPVVIKPIYGSKGKGVYSNIKNEQDLLIAFNKCYKDFKPILIEKFFLGKDYRFLVIDQEVVRVVERIPCTIVGDGEQSIQELIDTQNKLRLQEYLGFGNIQIDNEIVSKLKNRNLSLKSVLAKGEHFRLREISNVSLGGRSVSVIENAHPDNVSLAREAAANLRLDIAGVDILLPDISISWKQSGAHICEVNVQPQMPSTFPAQIIKGHFRNNGRIPVIVCVVDSVDELSDLLEYNSSKFAIIAISERSKTANREYSYNKKFISAIKNVATNSILFIYNITDVLDRKVFPFDVCDTVFNFTNANLESENLFLRANGYKLKKPKESYFFISDLISMGKV